MASLNFAKFFKARITLGFSITRSYAAYSTWGLNKASTSNIFLIFVGVIMRHFYFTGVILCLQNTGFYPGMLDPRKNRLLRPAKSRAEGE